MANPKTKKKAKVEDTTPTVAETRNAEADKGLLQRVDTPAISTAPKTTIEGLKGEDIKVADPLVTASLERIKEQEDAKKVENTIKDTYNSPLMSLGAKISEMEEAKKNAKANDETAQRRARSMQMVAGISDGLASLANLIGVGHYDSSNINTGNSLSPLAQKMEAARLERKADIKSIDDRLEQYRNQMDQLRMQKGAALANLYQQQENQKRENAREQKRMDFQAKLAELGHIRDMEKLKEQQEFTAEESRLARESHERMNNADNTTIENRYQAEIAAREAREKAKPENQRRILNENMTGVRDELAQEMGYADYNEYLRYQEGHGRKHNVDGQSNRSVRKTREAREIANPEAESLLELLQYPEGLTDEQIQMIRSISKTFAKAATSGDDDDFSSYIVK